jgi:hypothetical protein
MCNHAQPVCGERVGLKAREHVLTRRQSPSSVETPTSREPSPLSRPTSRPTRPSHGTLLATTPMLSAACTFTPLVTTPTAARLLDLTVGSTAYELVVLEMAANAQQSTPRTRPTVPPTTRSATSVTWVTSRLTVRATPREATPTSSSS